MMGHRNVTEVIIGVLFCLVSAVSARQANKSVWVLTGGKADLPCPHTPKHSHDQPILVLWYRSSDTLPIYSYDAREGDFTSGVRWADEKALGGRAFFRTASDPPALVLEPARAHDQGVYTCRVDFRISPSTTAVVNLTVVIPAGQPTIMWRGHVMEDSFGPLKEDSKAKLTCHSEGGRPPPDLTWWNGGRQLPLLSSKSISDPYNNTYWSEAVVLVRASRHLHGSTFSCHALTPTDKNAHQRVVCQPKMSDVSMNITLPPLEVEILGQEEVTVSAGTMVTLTCRALGSHPPARLTWWRGHAPLRRHVTNAVSADGNMTTAALTMKVDKSQNGATLACIANNPAIAHQSITRTIKLEVQYLPVVELTLGQPLEADNIKEGDDVYFECSIVANPKYRRVDWYHDDVPVEHNVSAGVVVSGLSLVMRRLSPYHSGAYTCGALNQEGYSKSNPVVLTVRHAPVCVGDATERVQGASRGTLTVVRCKVLAEPSRNITWTWVRIRTDGSEEEISKDRIQSSGVNSNVLVTPLRQEDYGRLMCRATNDVGKQRRACVINLIPAGPPDSPSNCTAEPITPNAIGIVQHEDALDYNMDEDAENDAALAISCMPGFDGGLSQYFLLEAWQDDVAVANFSSEAPIWFVSGLKAGVGVTLKIGAHNRRGHSEVIRMEVHTASAEHRAAPGETDSGVFGIPPLLGGVVGIGGVLLLLLIMGAVVAKYARPQKTPTHVHTLVMTATNATSGKKAGIFDPDVVTSLRRHTDSLDVLPRTANVQKSSLAQTSGQRQAFIQTQGQTVTKAYVHKHSHKQPSLSRGFCIRRQDSPFTDTDSDDSDDSDSDSTFTDLTAAGRAASRLPPAECRSNSFPRSNPRNLHHMSTSFDSKLHCCQGSQLLSSSEGRLQQLSCLQPSSTSSSGLRHIATSTGEMHQIISSTGELQQLITATGGLQQLTSRGEIHHLTSTTGTLQHVRSTSKELKHLTASSPKLQHQMSSAQDQQYPRSSSLDGLHTFVFSEELQRFLTSRELCQISYSEKRIPLVPATTMWQTINSTGEFMPAQQCLGHPSTGTQPLSTAEHLPPVSSALKIDPPASFRGVQQTLSNINLNLHPGSDLQAPSAFKKVQSTHSQSENLPMALSEKVPQNVTQEICHMDLSIQGNHLDEPFPCGELLPPPSFREPYQKSPTEELPIMRAPEKLQSFNLISTLPHSTPGPIPQSASFSGFHQKLPMSIELQNFHTSDCMQPILSSETALVNARVASSASCGELELKSTLDEIDAAQLYRVSGNSILEPTRNLQKLFDSSREMQKALPSGILRSPKTSPKSALMNRSGSSTVPIPRPLANKVNKPTVRFCDTLVTEGGKNRYTETSFANESNDGRGKPKQVSFAEVDGRDKVLVRKTQSSDAAKSSAKRCAQLFASDECGFVSQSPFGETSRADEGNQTASLQAMMPTDNCQSGLLTTDGVTKTPRQDPPTPTKPLRGTNSNFPFGVENHHQTILKPSVPHNYEEKDLLDLGTNLTNS